MIGFVPETEVARVRMGAGAAARLATGQRLRGTVTFISRAADPLTRTFRVEVEVPNPQGEIRDGQTVEIAIAADGLAAHLLPQSALTLDDDGRLGVRSLGPDNRVRFLPVEVVRDSPAGVWVSGLPETVDVITVGQDYVSEGVEVEPVYGELLQ